MKSTEDQKKVKQFDLAALMEPYKEGGTEENPIVRSLGGILYWLTVTKKFPADIAGGAIVIVFLKIMAEGHFKGDSTYGSAGNELDNAIFQVASDMYKEKTMTGMYKKLAQSRYLEIKRYIAGVVFESQAWCFKMWSVKYWKFRALKRREKKKAVAIKKQAAEAWKKKEEDRIKNGAS